jgi:hypothetical protein
MIGSLTIDFLPGFVFSPLFFSPTSFSPRENSFRSIQFAPRPYHGMRPLTGIYNKRAMEAMKALFLTMRSSPESVILEQKQTFFPVLSPAPPNNPQFP